MKWNVSLALKERDLAVTARQIAQIITAQTQQDDSLRAACVVSKGHEQSRFSLVSHSSFPLVELVRSHDSLKLPQIALMQVHRLGVASSQTLSNVGVMQALSVAELSVTEGQSKS